MMRGGELAAWLKREMGKAAQGSARHRKGVQDDLLDIAAVHRLAAELADGKGCPYCGSCKVDVVRTFVACMACERAIRAR